MTNWQDLGWLEKDFKDEVLVLVVCRRMLLQEVGLGP